MNINNIFAGILGAIIGIALLFMLWTPVTTATAMAQPQELQIFLNVAFVIITMLITVYAPIALTIGDDVNKPM